MARELFKSFDAVICPVMPTPALSARPFAESRNPHIDIDARTIPIPINWRGPASHLPGLPATAIPIGLSPARLADRGADPRPVAGRSHAVKAGPN